MGEYSYSRSAGGFNVPKLLRELIKGLNETPTIQETPDGMTIKVITSPDVSQAEVDAIVVAHTPDDPEIPLVRQTIQQEESGTAVEQTIITAYGVTRVGRLRLTLSAPDATPHWVLEYSNPTDQDLSPWGDFEGDVDLSGWGDGSTFYGAMTIGVIDTDAQDGVQCLSFTTPDTATFHANASDLIPFPESAPLVLNSMYIKQVSANLTSLTIAPAWYDENGDQIIGASDVYDIPTLSLGNWVALTVPQEIVSPKGARAFRLYFGLSHTSAASVELLRVDSISLSAPSFTRSLSFQPYPTVDQALEFDASIAASYDVTTLPPRPAYGKIQLYARDYGDLIGVDPFGYYATIFGTNWPDPMIFPPNFYEKGDANANFSNVANRVFVCPIFFPMPRTIQRIKWWRANNVAGAYCVVGFYDMGGARVPGNSFVTLCTSGAPQVESVYISGSPSFIRYAGWYYVAWASTTNTINTLCAPGTTPTAGAANAWYDLIGDAFAFFQGPGYASNTLSSTTLPATLGTITRANLTIPRFVFNSS